MKKFNVTVNGKTYEVEVEDLGGSSAPVSTPAPKAAPAPTRKPAASKPKAKPKKAAPTVSAGESAVNAPMPGTVVDVKVSEGDTVSEGDVLLILEAMKMENEIVAPSDGTVSGVHTSKGASVNSGDALITLE